MNETVKEWIEKAENDFATAGREIQVSERPNYDDVCFHSQQCIEKLLKGIIIHHGHLPPKTHDLVELSKLLAGFEPRWSWPLDELRFLTRAAVSFRYPGESADKQEAKEALETAARIRASLLEEFFQGP